MSKPRATNFPRWIKRTGSKINTLCRSVLNFRRSKTYPVRLKTRKRKNILTIISKNIFLSSKYSQRQRFLPRGFILPTIAMIMLVFSLVASSMILRTSQNTQTTIGNRESDVTYNLATPAVERAKAKIEFLFKRDYRYPNAIPTEETLERLMLNQRLSEQTQTDQLDPYMTPISDSNGVETGEVYEDIYKLPDESRIDINGDTVVDNAWAYDTDIDGDGNQETVAYSILMMNSREVSPDQFAGVEGNYTFVPNSSDPNRRRDYDGTVPTDSDKAANLTTRTGPLTLLSGRSTANCSIGSQNKEGWYPINTATVRKNFQVNAVVIKKNEALRNVSSIEFQQDRQVDLGNKWAVWFRYDLEAYPGPDFNMNGAMHTEGNIIWGDTNGGSGINSYLISSPASCLYTEDASEITLSQVETRRGRITFQGQVLNGNPTPDNYLGQSTVDIYPGSAAAPTDENLAVVLKKETDSITDSLQTNSPYQFSLDPISVFTRDVSASRYSDPTNQSVRFTGWNDSKLHERLFNKLIRRPYVDDTYRADDRWGPKPTYTNTIAVPNGRYGKPISGRYRDELTKEDAPSYFPERVGLDGYWERRARVEGLRIITGQRLELGNAFGWNNPAPGTTVASPDPLYPLDSTTLNNLARQRRSLRDNLAAVQSTLFYHYKNDKDFPIATLATTVHPGTSKTRNQATNFKNLPYKYKNEDLLPTGDTVEKDHVNTDFLTGIGTNGWEFNPPGNATNQNDFAAQIGSTTYPLRIALDNLARFAGDPNGAFPPKTETTSISTTNPYPLLSMWGDFSELRRALSLITNTNTYADLSIADRTTIQTAATTVGLLAYNVENLKKQYEGLTTDLDQSTSGMTALAQYFWLLIDGDITNGEVNNLISPKVPFPSNYDAYKHAANFYGQFTPDQYIEAFRNMPLPSTVDREALITKARLLGSYIQIERDRLLGFKKGFMASPDLITLKPVSDRTPWEANLISAPIDHGKGDEITNPELVSGGSSAGVVLGEYPFNTITSVGNGLNTSDPTKKEVFKTSCDPKIFTMKPDGTSLTLSNIELAGLSVALCPPITPPTTLPYTFPLILPPPTFMAPKYPALYFIFPKYNHNYKGKKNDTEDNVFGVADDQPDAEPYIGDSSLSNTSVMGPSFSFEVLSDVNNNKIDDAFDLALSLENRKDGVAAIALQPRALADWKIPTISSTTESTLVGTSGDLINKIDFSTNIAGSNPTFIRIPFLDKAFYDGRQLMQVRSLDIDLKMLRDNSVGTTGSTDTWLTKSGIIYAFREDAIREDEIARPAGTTFANCDTEAELFTDSCRMKVNTLQDPPNNDRTGVSLKPIDFYPDPDRRAHSFRLRNGTDISRIGTNFGISFISDNPIYIQGDLNLHQNSSNNLLEEFTQTLSDSWDNFYTRSTKDTSFAKTSSDRWRPVEILGDALTVLSKGFCDGTFEDGMRNNDGDCPSDRTSSYRNSTLANANSNIWTRENPYDSSDNSPILVNRNAQIFPSGGTTPFTDYRTLQNNKPLNNATDTSVNAMLINGLVPSRKYQSYGGLHNFPRFIENWGSKTLKIFGAFIQLKFSTYATAPWDQEAWEPGNNPVTGERIQFYNPPKRRWGYDVAMQYAPAGPIASRFVSVGSPRNEFYQEISTDDPYTKQLRCATYNGNIIDSRATDCN